jgi:putative transposase
VDVRIQIAKWPENAARGAVSQFCREVGISRSAFYEIRAAAKTGGPIAAVSGQSRRPLRSPTATPSGVAELVVWARKQLADDGCDNGPISIVNHLKDLGLPCPSRATVARILTARGQVVPAPKKRPRAADRRFRRSQPNELWQIDGTEWLLADGAKVVILQVLDDHSRRMVASHVGRSENTIDVWAAISKAIENVGVPEEVLTDNGAALNPTRRSRRGVVESRLRALGVKPITSRPGHPQTCGKNERVHQTLQKWLRARPPAETIEQLQQLVDQFDDYYNHRRRNQALSNQTPMHTWHQTQAALPPTPPTPGMSTTTEQAETRSTSNAVRELKASSNSNLCMSVAGTTISIRLGQQHASTTVLAIITGDTISIFDRQGTQIRTITIEPDRRYYGLGRFTKKPKLSGMS